MDLVEYTYRQTYDSIPQASLVTVIFAKAQHLVLVFRQFQKFVTQFFV